MSQPRPNSRILDASETKAKNDANKAALVLAKTAAKDATTALKGLEKAFGALVKRHATELKDITKRHSIETKLAQAAIAAAKKDADKAAAAVAKLTPAPAVPANAPASKTVQ